MNYIFFKGTALVPAILILSALLLSSCAPSSVVMDDDEYSTTELNASELFAEMPNYDPLLQSIEGKARAQISRPGESERATIYFTSNRDTSLLRVRNTLGIEGGRVLSMEDSVTLYNRIDEYAQRFSKEDAAYHYLNGITAMNLVEIMNPDIRKYGPEQVLMNDEAYLIVMDDGSRFYLDRDDLHITRVEYPTESPEAFSIFVFQDHVMVEGYRLPRRIQILSSDQKSNIFLLIRSLEVNPPNLEFDLEIPEDIQIERI
ncbi:MAG: DUF4292 domain-containing protein [Balneolales bacterium]